MAQPLASPRRRPGTSPRKMTSAVALLAAVLVILWPTAPAAHDIPIDVTVQAFLKPEGQRLQLLVRAPLGAMRDVEIPTRGPGYLDLAPCGARAPRSGHRVDRRLHRAVRRATRRLRLRGSWPCGSRCRPTSRSRTFDEALAHVDGPAASERHRALLEPGPARRALRVPDRLGASRFSIHPRFSRLGCARSHGAAVPAARRRRARLRAAAATRASSGSIRGGTRRRSGSSSWASSTSWTGPTTCSFCCAS